jgi:general secretion pathway protein A
MEYLKFYGLDAEPFQNNSDPGFYYESRAQHHARMRVLRGIHQQRGLCVVVGEAGLGKTTLAAHLAASLDPKQFAVRMRVIPHVACASGWLLPEFARSFDAADSAGNPARMIERIEHSLLRARAAKRHPVLIFDEAQLLASPEAMQEFRSLLNLQEDGRPLLSIALFGLKELADVLRLDTSLAQRVDVRAEMGPLDDTEVPLYIAHRITTAGGTPDLFDSDALGLLARLGNGIPRLINTLADNALFEASLAEARPVGTDAVWAAAEQLGMTGEEGARPRVPEVPLAVEAEPEPEPEVEFAQTPAAAAAVVRAAAEPAAPRRVATPKAPAPVPAAAAPAPAPPAPAAPAPDAPAPKPPAPVPAVAKAAAPAAAAPPAKVAAPAPAPARVEAPAPAPRPVAQRPAPAPVAAPEPELESESDAAKLALEPILGGGESDDDLFAGLIADTDATEEVEAAPAPELDLEGAPEADEELLDAAEDALLLEESTTEDAAASADAPADDELLDMAEFLEVEEKPAAPAPKPAPRSAKPAAAPAPAPKPAEPAIDGELDDLFEQIQLGD